jgi:hypothetical protein
VSTICDIFRGELNSLFCAQMQKPHSATGFQPLIFMTIIPQLNKLAHSYFERCTRAYRGIIVGHTIQFKHIDLAKKMMNASIISQLPILWERMHYSINQNVFEKIHASALPSDLITFAWHMSRALNVHPLPPCVMQNQLTALSKRYGGDMSCIEKCRMIHVCVVCVIRRGSIQGMRLRHDCQTGSLSCIHCNSNTILSIDTMGRIVCIGNDRVILSSCCGTFIHYGGSGFDFSTQCNIHCEHSRQLFKKKEKHLSSKLHLSPNLTDDISLQDKRRKCKNIKFKFHCDSISSLVQSNEKQYKKQIQGFSFRHNYQKDNTNETQPIPQCEMCSQKNVHQNISLLNVRKRCMTNLYLCSKHVLPQHISKSILHHDHLFEYFALNSSHKRQVTDFNSPICVKDVEQVYYDPTLEHALFERKGRRGRKPKYLAKYLLNKKMQQDVVVSDN